MSATAAMPGYGCSGCPSRRRWACLSRAPPRDPGLQYPDLSSYGSFYPQRGPLAMDYLPHKLRTHSELLGHCALKPAINHPPLEDRRVRLPL
jgi:hypothetical protein